MKHQKFGGGAADIASGLLSLAGKKGAKAAAAVRLGKMAHNIATGVTKFGLGSIGSGLGLIGQLIGGKFGAKLSKVGNYLGTAKAILKGGAGGAFAALGLVYSLGVARMKKKSMARTAADMRALCVLIKKTGGVHKVKAKDLLKTGGMSSKAAMMRDLARSNMEGWSNHAWRIIDGDAIGKERRESCVNDGD